MHLFRCGYRSYRVGFLVRMFVFFSNRYVLFPDFFNQSSISFAFSSLQIILTLPYFRASGTYLSETSNRPSLHLSSQSCCHQVPPSALNTYLWVDKYSTEIVAFYQLVVVKIRFQYPTCLHSPSPSHFCFIFAHAARCDELRG